MLTPSESAQQQVNTYFQSSSEYWKRIYETRALLPLIYQTRHAVVLEWVLELGLSRDSRILEIGCGAGLLTSELARMGYSVDAVDSVPAMVEQTIRKASENRLTERVRAFLADVHALPCPRGRFELVIAIGVIPWLHDERAALLEMQGALAAGGHLIVTADNESRLNRILDPVFSPAFRLLRKTAKFVLDRAGLRNPPQGYQSKRHTPAEIARLLDLSGLHQVKSRCVGFGPFTMLGPQVIPERLGIRLHTRAQ